MAVIRTSVAGITKLSDGMRAAPPQVYARLKDRVRAAGELIAADTRTRARWSTQIPPTVKSRAVGTRAVISMGGAKAKLARAYEHGGKPGQFRHPVFAGPDRSTWVWVGEPQANGSGIAHPMLHPALEAQIGPGTALLNAGVIEALASTLGGARVI